MDERESYGAPQWLLVLLVTLVVRVPYQKIKEWISI